VVEGVHELLHPDRVLGRQIAELEAENEELRERLCRIERRMMASLR